MSAVARSADGSIQSVVPKGKTPPIRADRLGCPRRGRTRLGRSGPTAAGVSLRPAGAVV